MITNNIPPAEFRAGFLSSTRPGPPPKS